MTERPRTQQYEIEAWLGDDHGLTDEQITELTRIADDIAERYPDQDDEEERTAALTVAYRLMVEDPEAVVTELGAERTRARATERAATVALQQAARLLIDPSASKGGRGLRTQAGFARISQVDRMAIRDWVQGE